MNEEQLRLFIRQAFAMANREAAVMSAVDPVLLQTMGRIRRLVEDTLPDGGLLREQTWRRMLPQVAQELQPLNDQLFSTLLTQISDMAPEAQEEARKMVQAVAAPQTPVYDAPEGFRTLTLAGTVQAIMRTQVAGRSLEALFNRPPDNPFSRFIRGSLQTISQKVQTGILNGTSTRDIAKEMATIIRRGGQEYLSNKADVAATIRRDSVAIARTAIQDANSQIKEAVYDANEDVLAELKWEWVAALDSRTCPTCAPLDGRRWSTKAEAPGWPIHPNCRCQVIPVDPDEATDVRSGQVVSETKMEGERAYRTKIKVKGDKLYRKAIDVKPGKDGKPPTYADFLAQSNPKTQQMFFGGGNAGAKRADRFRRMVKAGEAPEQALRSLIDIENGVGRFKPAVEL